jgi:hypothetical protein
LKLENKQLETSFSWVRFRRGQSISSNSLLGKTKVVNDTAESFGFDEFSFVYRNDNSRTVAFAEINSIAPLLPIFLKTEFPEPGGLDRTKLLDASGHSCCNLHGLDEQFLCRRYFAMSA